MVKADCIVALDEGTSNAKAVVVNAQGRSSPEPAGR